MQSTISLEERIWKTRRLLRRMEDDKPYMDARFSPLGAELRQSANAFAENLRAQAEAELQRLIAERATGRNDYHGRAASTNATE